MARNVNNPDSHTLVVGGVRHAYSFYLTGRFFNFCTGGSGIHKKYFYLHKRKGFLHLDLRNPEAELRQDFYSTSTMGASSRKNSFDVLFFERCPYALTHSPQFIETCKFYLKNDGYILIQGCETADFPKDVTVLYSKNDENYEGEIAWALIQLGQPNFDKLPEDAKELILKSGWSPSEEKKDKEMSSIEIHGRYGKR